MKTTVVCWNIAARHEPWQQLRDMDADIALLQEARKPPPEVADGVDIGPEQHWDSHCWNSRWFEGRFPQLYDRWSMIVKLSNRVDVEWFKQVSPISDTRGDEFAVSGIGTVAAARVTPEKGLPFIVVSMYARWMMPHASTGTKWQVGYPDGSAHRIISDLSAFIGNVDPATHRILAAGDLNTCYDTRDGHDKKWTTARDHTIWDRMHALGLEFLGPRYPNGRQAQPTPDFMKPDNRNVVTCHTSKQSPATADRQMDYAFASRGFHESVTVQALNGVDEWGASDHCRLLIDVASG